MRQASFCAAAFFVLLSGCTSSSSVPVATSSSGSSPQPAAPLTSQSALPANATDVLTLPSAFSFGVTLTMPAGASWPAGVNATVTESGFDGPTPQRWQRRPLDTAAPSIVESWQLALSGSNSSAALSGAPAVTVSGLSYPAGFALELLDATSGAAPTVFTYVPSSAGTYAASGSTFSIALGDAYYLELVTQPQTTVFQYTGQRATWTAPLGAQILVQAYGAQSGNATGRGGVVSAITNVAPQQQLFIFVGGQGRVATPSVCFFCTGGFNGGGNGGEGGGGASDIRITAALAGRTLVAGGGGGGGGGGVFRAGPPGGNQTGGALDDPFGRAGGGGGIQSGGTAGRDDSISISKGATAGSLGQGGDGALGPGGGGGGGGWYGGGGGGAGFLAHQQRSSFGIPFPGGGGSSLAVPGLWTAVNYQQGVRYGNGAVIISIIQQPN
jgi:hypothetical protein